MAKKPLVCVRCGETKAESEFVNDRTRSSGKFPWCKPCVIETRKAREAELKLRPRVPAKPGERQCLCCLTSIEGMHTNRLYCSDSCKNKVRAWRTYGLEPHEYRELIASNHGKCPICRKNVKKWFIDHNHTTGETTGAVCHNCNANLLGYSYHSTETAQRLTDYLTDPPVRRLFGEKRYVGPENVSNLDRMWGWSRVKRQAA